MLDKIFGYVLIALCVILGILIIFAIIKSIKGPKVADRIVAINMISTFIVMILCILTVYYSKEGYLADVSILYVMISFVAIIVLANVFINVNIRKKFKNDMKKEDK
ncbi:MAG: monovalent cation/H+ antiporter complex subunit F [Erysipelotrichaceae bacterium]|nr:monovalent cation/H+ antiporter complex subunit F [Erysipelotrichaceae bacterium]